MGLIGYLCTPAEPLIAQYRTEPIGSSLLAVSPIGGRLQHPRFATERGPDENRWNPDRSDPWATVPSDL
jgi:hypothetical protein